MVTALLVGLKVYPVRVGVTVYVPAESPVNEYDPEASVVVEDALPPEMVIVTPPAMLPLTLPERVYVVTVVFVFVPLLPFPPPPPQLRQHTTQNNDRSPSLCRNRNFDVKKMLNA